MARIRSVKPQLRTSLTAAEWPREVRYFWVLLWGYLDDHGRGVDDARLIKADCFPLDDDLTRAIIDDWLTLMSKPTAHDDEPAVCRYEVKGRRYLHAPKWTDHQKPQHPKPTEIPPCPRHHGGATSTELHDNLMKPSGDAREDLTPEVEVYREVEVEGERVLPDAAAQKRGTRIPEGFTLTDAMRRWATEKAPDVDVGLQTVRFINYWTSKTRDNTKLDWVRTWQNWMLGEQDKASRYRSRDSPNLANSPGHTLFNPDDHD